jgi:hypothetical protein
VRSAAGLLLVLTWVASPLCAQERPANPYRLNAADEDWTFLETVPKSDFWDPVKYIPLGREAWSLTLSGELRLRPEGLRVRQTEARPATVDNYLLQRYLLGADLRMGRRVRLFAEAQSGIINGQLRSPRPTDRNPIDLHQLFVEYRQPFGRAAQLMVTAGRQELEIGSSRLISASPVLNVKRSFDGVGLSYRAPGWRVAAAVANLVGLQSGAFDDRRDAEQLFWGVGAGGRGPLVRESEAGAYYLGLDRDASLFAQGVGPERRHTVGVKWNGRARRVDFNYDGVVQWGQFDAAPIRAWALVTETGLRLSNMSWRPRLSFRADIASGDADPEERALQSFNPLFPPELLAHVDARRHLCHGPARALRATRRLREVCRDQPWPDRRVAGHAACAIAGSGHPIPCRSLPGRHLRFGRIRLLLLHHPLPFLGGCRKCRLLPCPCTLRSAPARQSVAPDIAPSSDGVPAAGRLASVSLRSGSTGWPFVHHRA